MNIFCPSFLLCFRCSKELSHWDGSFEYPKHILSINEKLPVPIFWKIYNTAIWILLRSCFWSATSRFGEIKQFHNALELWCKWCTCILLFAVFKNLKSSFSEDNMPEHALVIFIKKRHRNGLGYHINCQKRGSNLKAAPKLCIFLYNAMVTTGVRQGMIIMHLGVMDTVFHSGDAWDSIIYAIK